MSSGHSHLADAGRQTLSRLSLALGLTAAFVVIEAAAGLWANSLALLTDAAHNFSDAIALGLSWYALRLATQPATAGRTFGYHRAGILVALVNSTTLVVIALGIFYEAYQRLLSPPEVRADVLIGVGLVAFAVNAGTAWLIRRGHEHDLNLRSAYMHLMGDVLSTLGAVAAGVAIAFTGMNWLDPLVSVLIGLLILWNGWGILRQSVRILLQHTPEDVDMAVMVADMRKVPGIHGVHDLHVWSLTERFRVLSAHVLTNDVSISQGVAIQRAVGEMLKHNYGIAHATLQLECEDCEPDWLYCDMEEKQPGSEHVHER